MSQIVLVVLDEETLEKRLVQDLSFVTLLDILFRVEKYISESFSEEEQKSAHLLLRHLKIHNLREGVLEEFPYLPLLILKLVTSGTVPIELNSDIGLNVLDALISYNIQYTFSRNSYVKLILEICSVDLSAKNNLTDEFLRLISTLVLMLKNEIKVALLQN